MTPSLSLKNIVKRNEKDFLPFEMSTSASFNSFSGLKSCNIGAGYSLTTDKDKVNFRFPMSTSLNMISSFSYTPRIELPMKTVSFSQTIKLGGEVLYLHPNGSIKETITIQSLQNNNINRLAYGYLYSQNSMRGDDILDVNREKDGIFKGKWRLLKSL